MKGLGVTATFLVGMIAGVSLSSSIDGVIAKQENAVRGNSRTPELEVEFSPAGVSLREGFHNWQVDWTVIRAYQQMRAGNMQLRTPDRQGDRI